MRVAIPFSLALVVLLLVGISADAQTAGNPIQKRGFYRTMNMYGLYAHTAGFGGYYRRGWRQTGFVNRILNVELLNLNHPKQIKKAQSGQTSQGGYFLGKINSVFMLRGSFGWQKTWFDKEVKRGVRVSNYFLAGPSIAFAKPIFVEVVLNESDQSTEKYSDVFDQNNAIILGRASYLIGFSQLVPYPGIHAKMGLNFEYSPDDEVIRALEVGATFDAFAKKIPIMADTYNDQFYLTLYVAFHFGKRYL